MGKVPVVAACGEKLNGGAWRRVGVKVRGERSADSGRHERSVSVAFGKRGDKLALSEIPDGTLRC